MAKKKGNRGKQRSAARLAAVQALYDMELGGHSATQVIGSFHAGGGRADLDDETVPADVNLFADLVRGVTSKRADLDAMIEGAMTEKRPVERMEVLLRGIMRCGAYELSQRGDIDPPLTISEYVGVAQAFFNGSEPGYVNGLLDKLAHVIRPEDMESRKAKGETSGSDTDSEPDTGHVVQ